MADPIIPTPQDTQLLLQDVVTKTAAFNSTAIDLGAGFAAGGLGVPIAAVISVTALDLADGNETYSFTVQDSADNATFAAVGAALAVTAAGVVTAKGRITRRYVRIALAVSGTTPSITYKAWLNPIH